MGWCGTKFAFEKPFCYYLTAMRKAKKLKTYEDYLSQIPKSWDEPLREIHAIRWMHYEQEKKIPAKKRIALINKEARETIKEFGLKPTSII